MKWHEKVDLEALFGEEGDLDNVKLEGATISGGFPLPPPSQATLMAPPTATIAPPVFAPPPYMPPTPVAPPVKPLPPGRAQRDGE